jgi:hypothetical protein
MSLNKLTVTNAHTNRRGGKLARRPKFYVMADSKEQGKPESAMERALPYLSETTVMIRVRDITVGANIRQIRSDGVDKLYRKIRETGLLPVRYIALLTPHTTLR